MDKVKQWVTLSLLGAMVIMAAGWFLLVSPKKDEASAIREEAAAQTSANAVLRTGLEVLQVQAKDLPKKQAELAAIAAKLPDNPAMPAFIRALTAASAKAGVDFVSVTPGLPVAVAPAVVAAPVAAVEGEPAPTAQTVPDPAVPDPAVPVDPAAPAAGAAGVLAEITVTLDVVGDYYELQAFVSELENLPRALRVSNLALSPGSSVPGDTTTSVDDGRTLTGTITGSVFMAAGRPPETPVVAPVAAPAN